MAPDCRHPVPVRVDGVCYEVVTEAPVTQAVAEAIVSRFRELHRIGEPDRGKTFRIIAHQAGGMVGILVQQDQA